MKKFNRKIKKLFKSKVFTTLFSMSFLLLAGGTALLLTTIPVQAADRYGLQVSFWFDQPDDTSFTGQDKTFFVGAQWTDATGGYIGGLDGLSRINQYLCDYSTGNFLTGENADTTDYVDQLITQPAAEKAVQGYTFAGYYGGLGTIEGGMVFNANGEYTPEDEELQLLASGYVSYDYYNKYFANESGGYDLYLVAKWTPHITFNNGFTDDVMSGKVDFLSGTEVVQTREGYIFGGYYTGEDGSGTQVYNSDGAITDDGQTIDFSSPITLYAYWIDTWASSEYISQPSGAGDEQSPYLISTAEELAWIANQVNFHGQTFEGYVFKQTEDDIDLGDHIWLPIGTESTPFKGTFYGRYTDDYWIENMTISNEVDYASSGEQYIMDIAGLFGEVENATIENVWLITGEVYANNYAGGIVGAWEGNVSASNCSVADFSIICDSLKSDKSLCAGSIIAYIGGDTADSVTVSIDSCVIETSAIDVNSYASAYSGGVVGCIDHKNIQNSDITIKNCYVDWGCKIYAATCDGTTNNSACAGGIVGMIYNPNKTLNETISGCEIYANLIQGQSFNIAGSVAGGVIAVARLEAAECSLEMKDNYVSTSISGGATDNDNSVAIAYIGGMCGTIETSTLTIANIDFNNCVVEDSKISGYARYVGGAGLIGNLYLKNQGLLNVKNCDVLNSNIYFTTSGDLGYVSGLVGGVFYSDTIIENCNVLGGSISSSTTNDAYAGGLVGVDYSTTTTIDMCHVSAPILGTSSTAYAYVAGIIGYSNVNSLNITRSEITSNEITGNASTNCSTGGIVGYARDITAKTCFVKCPAISASSSTASVAVGGLAAQAKTINISACSVEAGVAGSTISDKTSYSGGLIGLGVSMNITGCLFDGTVAGSLAGLISGRVTENTSVVSNILCRTSSTLTTLVAYSSDSPSPTNVIVETDSGNYYIDGGDGFAKWGIVEDKPLPAELFWIASGASVCTIDWLTEKGYTVL